MESKKNGFLSFFGKCKDDFVIEKLSAKKYAIEDPNLFICQVLDYLAVTDPHATEIKKADGLYDALPRKLKIKFLEHDRPKTVQEFSAQLKRMSRSIKAKTKYDASSSSSSSSNDSDSEDAKPKTSQIFTLMTSMQAQMMRMTTELDKLKTDPQPHQFRNKPKQQRTCQLRIPGPQNDHRDLISSPSCRYSKMTEHEFADCTKQAWVKQQPWFTDRMHARDENGQIINNEHTHSKNQEN